MPIQQDAKCFTASTGLLLVRGEWAKIFAMNGTVVYEDFYPGNQDYHPGHQHLPLNINIKLKPCGDNEKDTSMDSTNFMTRPKEHQNNARLRDLTFRLNSLEVDLNEGDIPDELAARNLMGLLSFRLGKLQQSVEHFKSVLTVDANNINAIQNLAEVYNILQRDDESHALIAQVQGLLDQEKHRASENERNLVISCSVAEQAYAYAYDISLTTSDERKGRLETSLLTYERALSIGSSVISLEERHKWYFVMSTIFVRLDSLHIRCGAKQSARLLGFNRGINLLKEISKSDRLYHRALSWAYLGVYLERHTSFDTTPMAIHDCGFTGLEPLDCYSKAIELSQEHATILNRLAKVFHTMGKYELAIGASSMSIKVNDNLQQNISPLHSRARVYTSLYVKELSQSSLSPSTLPERSLLQKAMADLQQVIATAPSLRAFIDIGQVCYYMGVDGIKETLIVDEDTVNTALVYFAKALEYEIGVLLPELQLLRGKCLRIKGEENNALKCFKRAIEMERESSKNTQAFRYLMEILVQGFCQENALARDVIVNDVDRWICLALRKFDNDVINQEVHSLLLEHTQDMMALCKTMIKCGKMSLTKLCFSIFPSSLCGGET